jgi:hypothetical protein
MMSTMAVIARSPFADEVAPVLANAAQKAIAHAQIWRKAIDSRMAKFFHHSSWTDDRCPRY